MSYARLLAPVLTAAGSATFAHAAFIDPAVCKTVDTCLVLGLNALITIMFPVIVLMIVYTGFKFVVAQGRPQKISEARRGLMWVLVGSLVVLGSKALALAVEGFVTSM